MKRTFILLSIVASSFLANSSFGQIIVQGLNPVGAQGFYTYTNPTDWSKDLSIVSNAVQGFGVFADDGTAGDSLGCNTLVNGAAVSGKIAFIYRGDCNFAIKAKKAQDAGAIAVVIVNNLPGEPVGMSASATEGAAVTIPVVMVGQATGQLLRPYILAGTLEMYIGTKVGLFNHDLYIKKSEVIRPVSFATPSLIAQDTSEFKVKLGGTIRSYGTDVQTNPTLRAIITLNNTVLYDEEATATSIGATGDSLPLTLPDFFIPNATPNKYVLTYRVTSDSTDQDSSDNKIVQEFYITDGVYSKSRYDIAADKPISTGGGVTSATAGVVTTWGITMEAPKASRIKATGMQFAVLTNASDSIDLTNEIVAVSVYEWTNDVVEDGVIDEGEMLLLNQTFYSFPSDLQNQFVTVDFEQELGLADDKSYYFAVAYQGTKTVFYATDDNTPYSYSITPYNQYFNPVGINVDAAGEDWSSGFTSGTTPAIAVLTSVNNVSVEENTVDLHLNLYPNPATDVVNITFGNAVSNSNIKVDVIDVTGRTVINKQFNIGNAENFVSINTADLSSGAYFFKVSMNGQIVKSLPVVISK